MPVSHNLAKNTATENIVVEIVDQGGERGYGEGIPRHYVTGESLRGSLDALRQVLAPPLLGRQIEPSDALGLVEGLSGEEAVDRTPAAACALETALLDLAGKSTGRPVSALISKRQPRPVVYSAVVPLLGQDLMQGVLAQISQMQLRQVKVKVGPQGGAGLVRQVRRSLGPEAVLRVDANGAWSADQAISAIKELEGLAVEAVEQPVAKDDIQGMALVNSQVEALLLADESLCTASQARGLIEAKAVGGFNLRLSKLGGAMRTMRVMDMASQASQAGLVCQLGCQVGELGILSAMGRQFASVHEDLKYLEGSLTRFFVSQDLIAEDLSFGQGGAAPVLDGPGLGITVEPHKLEDSLLFSLS